MIVALYCLYIYIYVYILLDLYLGMIVGEHGVGAEREPDLILGIVLGRVRVAGAPEKIDK